MTDGGADEVDVDDRKREGGDVEEEADRHHGRLCRSRTIHRSCCCCHATSSNYFENQARRYCGWYHIVILILGACAIAIHLAVFYQRLDHLVIAGNGKAYPVVPGNSTSEHAVLLQVTDLHLSRFEPHRQEKFAWFIQEVVPAIHPRGIFATGDLTDGHAKPNSRDGNQQLSEWQAYQSTVDSLWNGSATTSTTQSNDGGLFYEDLRGNHDAYGTGTVDNVNANLYETYGASSASSRTARDDGITFPNKRTWRRDVTFGHSTYRFVGMDVTPEVGAGTPFNFLGVMSHSVRRQVLDLIQTNDDNNNITGTILLGHFPQSTVRGGFGKAIRDKVSHYLCGHFHHASMKQRLPGVGGSSNLIELEALDLKEHGGYRMVVVDHGQLSFSDLTMSDPWPAAVVSNPNDARYLSALEPRNAHVSTHVRVHAYTSSDANITQVLIGFDEEQYSHPAAGEAVFVSSKQGGQGREENAAPGNGGLFVLEWNPRLTFMGGKVNEDLQGGLHTLHLQVTDSVGRIRTVAQQFSFDGTTASIGRSSVQSFQALGDVTLIHRLLLASFVLGNAVLLLVNRKLLLLPVLSSESGQWARAMAAFLAFFMLDLAVGPILVGEVVDSPYISVVFSYGIVHPSAINPTGGITTEPQTVVFAMLTQALLVFPFLIWVLMHINDHPRSLSTTRESVNFKLLPATLFGLRGMLWGSWIDVVRSATKVVLPFYMLLMTFVAIRAMAVNGVYSPVMYLVSPVLWFVYLANVWILLLLSSCPAVPNRDNATTVDDEEPNDNESCEASLSALQLTRS